MALVGADAAGADAALGQAKEKGAHLPPGILEHVGGWPLPHVSRHTTGKLRCGL